MILILGLIILIAAVVIGLAGIFDNTGLGHGLGAGGDFSIFGYHATGSTGALFLVGIIVGAAALLGLALVMMGVRSSARRSARTRREMDTSRREAQAVDRENEHAREREELIRQRDDARAETAARDDAPAGTAAPVTDAPPDSPRGRGHWFGHRTAHR
ncbi:hypothetical protein [Streptomyces vinaceus]|uniref:hypothetical protein n=1 Tax=Streptomyces vinaceus TaxID=1960 RepID=UPI0036D09917